MLTILSACRFVLTPTKTVKDRLAAESEEVKSDLTSLDKKLHYLETTNKNSQEHLKQLFSRTGGS